jgi:hypothetical protein
MGNEVARHPQPIGLGGDAIKVHPVRFDVDGEEPFVSRPQTSPSTSISRSR